MFPLLSLDSPKTVSSGQTQPPCLPKNRPPTKPLPTPDMQVCKAPKSHHQKNKPHSCRSQTIPGRRLAKCSVPRDPRDEGYATYDLVLSSALFHQFTEPTRGFIARINVRLSFLAKRRSIDALKVALEEAMDGNTDSIVHFRDRQVIPLLPYLVFVAQWRHHASRTLFLFLSGARFPVRVRKAVETRILTGTKLVRGSTEVGVT